MWLFTPDGFYSIVQKPGEAFLTVRSRNPEDLDRLRRRYLPALSPTITTTDSDYPYRGMATHEQVSEAMAAITSDISYGNFKAEAGKTLGHARTIHLHQVWTTTRQWQQNPKPARKRGKARNARP